MNRFLIVLAIIFCSNARADESVLPPEIPRVRYSMDPLYIEQGFRLGHILDFAEESLSWLPLNIFPDAHYEGHLMLGFGSNPMPLYDKQCLEDHRPTKHLSLEKVKAECFVDQNPWPFSAVSGKLLEQYNNSPQGAVVVFYNKESLRAAELSTTGKLNATWSSTQNYVSKIWTTNPQLPLPARYPAKATSDTMFEEVGQKFVTSEGRIVKATMDHSIFKTYEITMQESLEGSNFKRLSVADEKLFDYIVATMLAGRSVRIRYVDLYLYQFNLQNIYPGYDTRFRVTSAEVL